MDAMLSAKWGRVTLFALVLLGGICPAMLFLAVYCPQFFRTQEVSKLLFISGAISFPIFLISSAPTMLAWRKMNRHRDREELDSAVIAIGCYASLVPLYGASAFRFLFGLGGPRTGLIIATLLACTVCAVMHVATKRAKEAAKRVHQQIQAERSNSAD